jgi:hypothetical protein
MTRVRSGEVKELMERLERDALRIAAPFGLRFRSLAPARAGVRSYYGICTADGRIRIRLRHASTGRPLKYSSLINTVCHELAHLRHFNHGPRFRAFYLRLLEFARREGVYQPGPDPEETVELEEAVLVPRPTQLGLFESR